jgi:hypothetical protein
MKVINVHKRLIEQPIEKVSALFETLASSNDKVWPHENWPAMRLDSGLQVGSKGGHGIIRYTIIAYKKGESIEFKFSAPKNFNGTHCLKLTAINNFNTEVIHTIHMETVGIATFYWIFIIRWLHDALIEEAFDKMELYFSELKQKSRYNIWVKILRNMYKKKNIKPNRIKSFH